MPFTTNLYIHPHRLLIYPSCIRRRFYDNRSATQKRGNVQNANSVLQPHPEDIKKNALPYLREREWQQELVQPRTTHIHKTISSRENDKKRGRRNTKEGEEKLQRQIMMETTQPNGAECVREKCTKRARLSHKKKGSTSSRDNRSIKKNPAN